MVCRCQVRRANSLRKNLTYVQGFLVENIKSFSDKWSCVCVFVDFGFNIFKFIFVFLELKFCFDFGIL